MGTWKDPAHVPVRKPAPKLVKIILAVPVQEFGKVGDLAKELAPTKEPSEGFCTGSFAKKIEA